MKIRKKAVKAIRKAKDAKTRIEKEIEALIKAGLLNKDDAKKLLKDFFKEMKKETKKVAKFAKKEMKSEAKKIAKKAKPAIKRAVKKAKQAIRR